MDTRNSKFFWVTFIIFVFATLIYFSLEEGLNADEGTHLLLSVFYRDLMLYLVKTHTVDFSNLWNFGLEYLYRYPKLQIGYTPLFHFISALLFSIFGLNEYIIRIFNVLVFIGTAILIYLLGKKLYSEKVGIISSLMFLSFYPSFRYASKAMTDTLSYFFVVLSILVFVFAIENNKKKYYALSGFLSSLAFLTKQTAGVSFAFIVLFYTWKNFRNILSFKKDVVINLILLVSGFVIPVVPYLLVMYKIGGFEILKYLSIKYGYFEGRPTSIFDINLWLWYFVNTVKTYPLSLIVFLIIPVYVAKQDKNRSFLMFWFLTSYILLSLVLNKHVRYSPLFFIPMALMFGSIFKNNKGVNFFLILLIISTISISHSNFVPSTVGEVVKYMTKEGNIAYYGDGLEKAPFSSVFMWEFRKMNSKKIHFRFCNFVDKKDLEKELEIRGIRYVLKYPNFELPDNYDTYLKKIKSFDNGIDLYEFLNYKKMGNGCNEICLTGWKLCKNEKGIKLIR